MSLVASGFTEVEQALRQLGEKAGKTMLRVALRAGAKPVAAAAESDAPKESGLLASSIKINNGQNKKGIVSVKITPSKAKLLKKSKYYYASSVEGGFFMGKRVSHVVSGKFKGGKFHSKAEYKEASLAAGRKFIPGVHFMERAYNATRGEAERIIGDELVNQVHLVWNT